MVNILVRTSGRPKSFNTCITSIREQRWEVCIIVGNDNNDDYCKEFNPVRFQRDESYDIVPAISIDTAKYFPFNYYLNSMLARVTEGWVMILDDDDMFTSARALKIITSRLREDSQVAFWRVDVCGNIIPTDKNWEKHPVKRDMSMIGFMFHSKYIPLLHIAPWKQADWRLADTLYGLCEPVWINEVLTKTQNNEEGRGNRIDR